MPFSRSYLKWWLAAGLAAVAAVQSATAQSPIIFSQPTDDKTAKPNPSMPPPSHNVPNTYNAPSSVFGGTPAPAFDNLPGASKPVPLTPEQTRQLQKFLEDQKNWPMMTPEEILGVKTPEQILGLQNPNNDPKLSLEERYLQRQSQEQSVAATNLLAGQAGSLAGQAVLADAALNPFQSRRADAPSAWQGDATGDRNGLQPQRLLDQPLNAAGNIRPGAGYGADQNQSQNQRPDSLWASAFDTPALTAKQNLEQAAEMDQFRALMNPVTPAENPARPADFQTPVTPALDPNLEVLLQDNPAGRSFTPLQSVVSRPTGIMPLPGITGYPQKPEKPKPAVQAPPWLSDGPQPFTPLQRKF